MNGLTLRTILYLFSFATTTAISVYLAVLSEQHWRPLPFSEFYLSQSEGLTIALILGIVTLVMLTLGRLLVNPSESKRQFSLDYLNFLLSYTFTILYFLLASTITFNPNLFVYIGIYSSLLGLLLHLFYCTHQGGFIDELLATLGDIFKRFMSVYGVIVLILFMTPLALAVGFIFSREVADVITEIRLNFNKIKSAQYTLVPALENSNFRRPMIARFSPEEKDKLYLLTREGRVFQVDYPSGGNRKLVLDLADKVGLIDIENGAQGLALHPQFSNKNSPAYKDIFVYYTSVHNNKQENILSRFKLDGSTKPNAVAENQLMVLPRNNDAFHNGGSVDFGPQGFLYIALGEGVYLHNNRTANESLRSGVMRIDVDMLGGDISRKITQLPRFGKTENYYIPRDNPFVDNDQVLDEYWALGLRNPFRMSFDSETGHLWLGDVGSTIWEEVNKITKGGNYLFPYIEGPKTADFVVAEELIGTPQHPTYTYKHSAFDRAVIGGVVYRGKALPELTGQYIYGDNFSGKIFAISSNQKQFEIGSAELIAQAEQYAQRGITSLTYSPEGEIFVTLLGAKNKDTGQLMKLTNFDQNIMKHIKKETEVHSYSYEETKSLYLESCARCHGPNGTGNGPDAKMFDVTIANFNSKEFKGNKSDQFLNKIIKEGGSANQLSPYMPPWQRVLSDNEIDDLVRYIRSLNQTE